MVLGAKFILVNCIAHFGSNWSGGSFRTGFALKNQDWHNYLIHLHGMSLFLSLYSRRMIAFPAMNLRLWNQAPKWHLGTATGHHWMMYCWYHYFETNVHKLIICITDIEGCMHGVQIVIVQALLFRVSFFVAKEWLRLRWHCCSWCRKSLDMTKVYI